MYLKKLRRKPFIKVIAVVMAIGLVGITIHHKAKQDAQLEIVENQVEQSNNCEIPLVQKIQIHTVKPEETLSSIAEQYNIDVATLTDANTGISEGIKPGQQLVILPCRGILHIVTVGDTLWRLATAYSIDINIILSANGKTNHEISVGEKIFIPGAKKTEQSEKVIARIDYPVSRGSTVRFSWPTKGERSSNYGYRWGRMHNGIDIANDEGTPIKTALAGRVSYSGWYSGYGNTVVIEHDQGYTTLYGHLADYIVSPGQYVKTGQIIAHMGSTGNSTGPHLHFEVQKDGQSLNPDKVLP